MHHFMMGVNFVVQSSALRYLSYRNAEVRAMGEAEVDMNLLRRFTDNEHVSQSFWTVLSVERVSLSLSAIILFCALI